ncbi:MAG: hypothetical protein K0R68_2279, partial [Mycobacterium sp.]|nr:hypothetical protein [Mycobacterium sp.]
MIASMPLKTASFAGDNPRFRWGDSPHGGRVVVPAQATTRKSNQIRDEPQIAMHQLIAGEPADEVIRTTRHLLAFRCVFYSYHPEVSEEYGRSE